MIKVLKAGLYDSLQDMGRMGYRKYGVPVSGAMDQLAFQQCNTLLGNTPNCAALEITLQGPELEFCADSNICLTGAHLQPEINKSGIPMSAVISIKKGDCLSFGKRRSGVRTYLGIQNGFSAEVVMGSKSWYKGVTTKYRLSTGDILEFNPAKSNSSDPQKITATIHDTKIKAYPGPEYYLLNAAQRTALGREFTVGLNNRMAYQLSEQLPNEFPSMISSTVIPGTVQLTPSGKLIILMRDCQTTGGYPRILQLSDQAINQLSQKMQFERFCFDLQPEFKADR